MYIIKKIAKITKKKLLCEKYLILSKEGG